MKQAIQDVSDWLGGIDRAARDERDPHRRAIIENYRQHVALEFNGRWEEFLGPDMTIDEPVYRTRLGTEHQVVADGYAAVLGFYHALNEHTVLTNQDERLAVADWGFVSHNTFNMFTLGRHLPDLGVTDGGYDLDAHYKVSRPIVMLWNYTEDAKLIGEEVFEVAPPTVERIAADEAPTWEEVRAAVSQYLPSQALRVRALAA